MAPDGSSATPVDREAALAKADKLQLRLWLRLLTCTHLIERRIRAQLRMDFETTLPRFDVLSQLHSANNALTMGELSTRLMVTSGNVTGLITSMEKDGLVARNPHAMDRRSTVIRMTQAGEALFAELIPVHRGWIDALMSGLSRADMRQLLELLAKLKSSVRSAEGRFAEPSTAAD